VKRRSGDQGIIRLGGVLRDRVGSGCRGVGVRMKVRVRGRRYRVLWVGWVAWVDGDGW
jgi:hypothetical protein